MVVHHKIHKGHWVSIPIIFLSGSLFLGLDYAHNPKRLKFAKSEVTSLFKLAMNTKTAYRELSSKRKTKKNIVDTNEVIPIKEVPKKDQEKPLPQIKTPKLTKPLIKKETKPVVEPNLIEKPKPPPMEKIETPAKINIFNLHSLGTVRTRLWMWGDLLEELWKNKTFILGVPFGVKWRPPRIIPWWESTDRIDPHNSFLAILYRIGIFGFLSLLFLIGLTIYGTIKTINRFSQLEEHKSEMLLLIASIGSIVYCVLHALTDVTLENPFKGMFLWIFMGICRNVLVDVRLKNPNHAYPIH